MKTLFSLLFLGIFSMAQAETIAGNCDTLFTKDGKMYFIQYHRSNKKSLEYSLCSDTTGKVYSLAQTRIERLARNKNRQATSPEKKRDEIERRAYKAYLYSLIGAIAFLLSGFVGVGFLIVGAIQGEKALRLLKKKPDHPEAKKIKQQAQTAILLGIVLFMAVIGLYLLILFLI